jgi:hypothetical protein
LVDGKYHNAHSLLTLLTRSLLTLLTLLARSLLTGKYHDGRPYAELFRKRYLEAQKANTSVAVLVSENPTARLALAKSCKSRAENNFKKGEGFVFFYHVTHHAGKVTQ